MNVYLFLFNILPVDIIKQYKHHDLTQSGNAFVEIRKGMYRTAAKIADAVKAQAAGMVQYQADKNGIVHAGVGKGSFSDEALTENIREFMTAIQDIRPDSFGKGKKKDTGGGGKGKSAGAKKDAKFYLTAYLSSTQGKGSVNIDLQTLDPTSAYFMGVAAP